MFGDQQIYRTCSRGLRGSYNLEAFVGAIAIAFGSVAGAGHRFPRQTVVSLRL